MTGIAFDTTVEAACLLIRLVDVQDSVSLLGIMLVAWHVDEIRSFALLIIAGGSFITLKLIL